MALEQARWVTTAELAALFQCEEAHVKRLLRPKLPRKVCPKYIHPEDVKRLSRDHPMILYSIPDKLPRVMEKPKGL